MAAHRKFRHMGLQWWTELHSDGCLPLTRSEYRKTELILCIKLLILWQVNSCTRLCNDSVTVVHGLWKEREGCKAFLHLLPGLGDKSEYQRREGVKENFLASIPWRQPWVLVTGRDPSSQQKLVTSTNQTQAWVRNKNNGNKELNYVCRHSSRDEATEHPQDNCAVDSLSIYNHLQNHHYREILQPLCWAFGSGSTSAPLRGRYTEDDIAAK